jgi:hypothetical protein
VFPVRYKLGFYIPEDGILHSHRRGNLKLYTKCVSDHGGHSEHLRTTWENLWCNKIWYPLVSLFSVNCQNDSRTYE